MPASFLRPLCVAALLAATTCTFTSCQHAAQATSGSPAAATLAADGTNAGSGVVRPVVVTQPVRYDTDDPAIWVNAKNPAQSLVIGTDKDSDGGLYVFDLQGKEVPGKTVHNLRRPNNVDLAYGLKLGGQPTDFALVTERETGLLRAFRLPDMQPLDHGNLAVFTGAPAEQRMPMGVAIYTRPADGAMFAVVGRKTGPAQGYLAQYRLADDGSGQLAMTLVRNFGTWSGKKEIESIAVDNELGFIYYSDEGVGVRKYYADPAKGNTELALFAKTGFTEDHEGISIYKTGPQTGYILVSDQAASKFRFFPRQGTAADPNAYPELRAVPVAAHFSDGSDVTNVPLNAQFPHGLFVAMSDNKTFHYYRWEDMLGAGVKAVR
jgi:3-phytase